MNNKSLFDGRGNGNNGMTLSVDPQDKFKFIIKFTKCSLSRQLVDKFSRISADLFARRGVSESFRPSTKTGPRYRYQVTNLLFRKGVK